MKKSFIVFMVSGFFLAVTLAFAAGLSLSRADTSESGKGIKK